MVLVGVDPFIRIIPHLMTGLIIWKRTPSKHDENPLKMMVLIVDNTPHQQNGYICDLFVNYKQSITLTLHF